MGTNDTYVAYSTDPFPVPPAASVATDGGGNWLSATYDPTKMMFDLKGNPANLADGIYSGEVTLSGSGSTQTIPVQLPVGTPQISESTDEVRFVSQNNAAPALVAFTVTAGVSITVTTKTNSGGPWLQAVLNQPSTISVSANASGLAAGTYTGAVTLTPSGGGGPTQVPAVLTVLKGTPPAIALYPPAFNFSAATGTTGAVATVTVDSGVNPAQFTVRAMTANGGDCPICRRASTPDRSSSRPRRVTKSCR